MKRILAILLGICILFTGCRQKETNEGVLKDTLVNDKPESYQEKTSDKDTKGDTEPIILQLSKIWSDTELSTRKEINYIAPVYEAGVFPYVIAEDLSNIENIERFSGLTKEQKRMLVQNGFFVEESRNTKMHYVYDSNEYKAIPNFITSDSVLHMYHQFYDKSLSLIEANFLYLYVEKMTKQMLSQSVLLYETLEDAELKELQSKNVVYFLVANMLLEETKDIRIEVEEALLETAKKEYDLTKEAVGFMDSPLFQKKYDYSQFKVRGHYTRSEKLGKFFKVMMWYGTAPLELIARNEINYENTMQALLLTYTAFLEGDEYCNAELWMNIYKPTSQYVGLADDIDVFTMNSLRKKVYGDNTDPNKLNDISFYDELIEEVNNLPEPRIQGKPADSSVAVGKQFRFMGQRYILDSFIMQNLSEPFLRPIPSALDVMGVLGSNLAEKLLFDVYKPQELWTEYEPNYIKLKETVSGYSEDVWADNLYNGWLWSLKEMIKEYDNSTGMPFFMKNDAWKHKSLNTALGSYAELKHDTILYGKQSMAEMGGPLEVATQHYVEPNVELYSKLLYLTDYTLKVLKDNGVFSEELLSGAVTYKEMLELLLDCSIRQLKNEPLTEEQKRSLLWYGGIIENITNSFTFALAEDFAIDKTDMLVADIATSTNAYLTVATGYYDSIYVVVPVENKLYLTRGSVYSHYEFISSTRLTDEEWWELQGIKIIESEFGQYYEMTEPSKDLPKQPDWIKNFKTKGENVVIFETEVDWSNLAE